MHPPPLLEAHDAIMGAAELLVVGLTQSPAPLNRQLADAVERPEGVAVHCAEFKISPHLVQTEVVACKMGYNLYTTGVIVLEHVLQEPD